MKKYVLTLAKKEPKYLNDFIDRVEIWHWDTHSQFDNDIKDLNNRKYIEDNDVLIVIGSSVHGANDWVEKIIKCQT